MFNFCLRLNLKFAAYQGLTMGQSRKVRLRAPRVQKLPGHAGDRDCDIPLHHCINCIHGWTSKALDHRKRWGDWADLRPLAERR